MNGLFRALASPVPFEVAGRYYPLLPVTLAGWASCESWVVLARESPLDTAERIAQGQPELFQERVFRRAVEACKASFGERSARYAEMMAWASTGEGAAFTAHLCLPSCPLFASLEAAFAYFSRSDVEQGFVRRFLRARDHASGTDLMASLDWRDSGEHAEPDDKERCFQWRRRIRNLADARNWLPEEVGRMTLYQLQAMDCHEDELLARRTVGRKDIDPERLKRRERPRPNPNGLT